MIFVNGWTSSKHTAHLISSIALHDDDDDAVAIGMDPATGIGNSHIFLFFSTLFGGTSLRFFVFLSIAVTVVVNVIPGAVVIRILVLALSSPVT